MDFLKIEINFKNFLIILSTILILFLIFKIKNILTPFAIAFFISYLLDPVVDRLENLKFNRTLSVLIVFVLFSLIVIAIILFIFPVMINEINILLKKIPVYLQMLDNKIKEYNYYAIIQPYINEIKSFVVKNLGKISNILLDIFNVLSGYLGNFLNFVLLYSIVPILIFYFLKDFDSIVAKTKTMLEKKGFLNVVDKSEEFNSILKSYFRGQFIVSVLLGILYSVTLLIVGIEGAVFVGVLSGILSMVPYLGFIVGFVTSLLLAFIQFQDLFHPLFVVLGFTIVQVIESNLITPKIVGESLGLHPVAVIFAIMVGGSLFGIAGMIFSLPIAALIKVSFMDNLLTD
ncbi:transporter [Deferribacter desulfuricans SSM1]|uniref:Transporter n=1 Tax=Deferribacter desulfuricans (strain DSM 14783 / JCM 11476 / NBRC 101012 / SSM1) TaxID=639282 RepID=D3P9R6_DEFDS|nr:AI-2E family transporter [Deferribacter desulfuricans]BAI81456.1 transporter [Deferribacter desulfuricans SSM1]